MNRKNDNFYNFFALVSIAVIIVSIASIGIKFTGKATDTGVVNVTIETNAAVNFTTDFINFGSGMVNPGISNATIYTNGTAKNGNWTAPTIGLILQNIGNKNITLDLKTGKTAATFLGGSGPSYMFNVSQNKSSSCTNVTFLLDTWYDVNTTNPGWRVCDVLNYADTLDAIEVDIKLVIPSDSMVGAQTDTFTATATAI